MNKDQFKEFITTFQDTLNALTINKGKGSVFGSSFSGSSSGNIPKISIKIPTYKGEPNENVIVWLQQTKNIFHAQDIINKRTMTHYTTTGLENAALHWFVNKVKNSITGSAFTS